MRDRDVMKNMRAAGWIPSGALFVMHGPGSFEFRREIGDLERAVNDPEWGVQACRAQVYSKDVEQFDFILEHAEEFAAHHMAAQKEPHLNRCVQLYAKLPAARLVEFRLLYGLD